MTFSTYGTHLPGTGRGSVDAWHCIPGSPLLPHNPDREKYWQLRLKESPFLLNEQDRLVTRQALLSVCHYRGWIPHAIHIRTNHVHAVIGTEVKPERILSDFKAYATRAIRLANPDIQRRRYWTDHGSTRYLWNEVSLNAAVEYVLDRQGDPMACYPDVLGR